MKSFAYFFWVIYPLLAGLASAQPPVRYRLKGQFLTDTIEIGRPFQYMMTFRHPPTTDVLFPDTARHFAPYRVVKMAIFATQTTGNEAMAVSRDSAVYTLTSFETDSVQLLTVPIRIINEADCTVYWTGADTVFLQSKLPPRLADSSRQSLTLATETTLAPLRQQFNYRALATGFLGVSVAVGLLYFLFGRALRRQWRLYGLTRQHNFFLRTYNRLSGQLTAYTAAETANQAIVLWKAYLELLDPQPYSSLTTSEIAERMHDERIADALREADRMIYGGAFSPQSASALRVLSEVASQTYQRRRSLLKRLPDEVAHRPNAGDSAQTSPFV
ncbi:hypothetical protein [Spirosoma areae]